MTCYLEYVRAVCRLHHSFLSRVPLLASILFCVVVDHVTAQDEKIVEQPPGLVRTLSGHRGTVRCVLFTPDGGGVLSGGDDATLRSWDTKTGEVLDTQVFEGGALLSLAVSNDGARLAVGQVRGKVQILDSKTGQIEKTLTVDGNYAVRGVAFSPDGAALAAVTDGRVLFLWDVATGELRNKLTVHDGAATAVVFAPNGKSLFTAGTDRLVRRVTPDAGVIKSILYGHQDGIWGGLAFSPDGTTLACGGDDHSVRLWDPGTGEKKGTLIHGDRVLDVAFSPGGAILASGGADQVVRIWEAKTGREVMALDAQAREVWAVAFSPDGLLLASAGADGAVRIWDVYAEDIPEEPTGEDLVSLVEPGWRLEQATRFADARAAHYNPRDGLLYAVQGRRAASLGGGLYRINADGSTTKLAPGVFPATVVVDPRDGDVFFSEDYDGIIYYTAFGTTGRLKWAWGFHKGDDDPIGMAIPPKDYDGMLIRPTQAVLADRGHNGLDEVWRFSTDDAADRPVVVHRDDGTLVNALDIAVGSRNVYVVDTGGEEEPGAIYELKAGGKLSRLTTAEPLSEPVAIAVAPVTGDLLVLEAEAGALLRIQTKTGAVSVLCSGFTTGYGPHLFAGLDITPDGRQLFVTDRGHGRVFTLRKTPGG